MSDIDLLILDVDGAEMLEHCLGSLSRQRLLPARVIVWDNGSKIPTIDRVRPTFPFETVFRRSEKNIGFTGGINAAMNDVVAPFVAWVNNDVVLDGEWLAQLRARFDDVERLGAVQSVMRRDSRTIDGAGIAIDDGTFRQLHHGEPIERAREPYEAWGVSGTAALFRTAALRDVAIGGSILHPRFVAYYEDVELSARLLRAGWSVQVLPTALAVHRGSMSEAALGRSATRYRVRNRYFVARLHPGIGRIPALLREDAKRIFRLFRSRQAGVAIRATLAMGEGLVAPL